MEKLISVIVPCYNQAQYLDECLQSVLDQTYTKWECIIVNDGSPDNTEEVAKKWIEKDERFTYVKKNNGGLSSARNFGIQQAGGEWILPLDADDYISERYLELASNHFKEEDIKLIYCKAKKFGAVNEEWNLPPFSLSALAVKNIIFCSAFFRIQDWKEVGGYDEVMKNGLEDWDFWIRILQGGGEVLKLSSTCFFYRIKENSMVTELQKKYIEDVYKYLEQKHITFFLAFLPSLHSLLYSQSVNKALNDRFLNTFVNRYYYVKSIFLKNIQSLFIIRN